MIYKEIFNLIRPKQYVKNLVIFFPLFFSLKLTDTALLLNASIAFLSFSLTASAVYILNDYIDITNDKQHPIKKYRPLASGSVSKAEAIAMMIILSSFGIAIMSSLSFSGVILILLYVAINIAYSLKLKQIPIIDIVIISIGFIIRIFIGSSVTNTDLLPWIVLMTFLLSLFIALGKRRDDVIIFNESGKKMRKVTESYNLEFINTSMAIMAAVVLMVYIEYCLTDEVISRLGSDKLYLSSFFVLCGVLRYLQITIVKNASSDPTNVLLNDRKMLLIVLGWFLCMFCLLYLV